MKINIQVEVDTENAQDLTTIEELIAMLRSLADQYEEQLWNGYQYILVLHFML